MAKEKTNNLSVLSEGSQEDEGVAPEMEMSDLSGGDVSFGSEGSLEGGGKTEAAKASALAASGGVAYASSDFDEASVHFSDDEPPPRQSPPSNLTEAKGGISSKFGNLMDASSLSAASDPPRAATAVAKGGSSPPPFSSKFGNLHFDASTLNADSSPDPPRFSSKFGNLQMASDLPNVDSPPPQESPTSKQPQMGRGDNEAKRANQRKSASEGDSDSISPPTSDSDSDVNAPPSRAPYANMSTTASIAERRTQVESGQKVFKSKFGNLQMASDLLAPPPPPGTFRSSDPPLTVA